MTCLTFDLLFLYFGFFGYTVCLFVCLGGYFYRGMYVCISSFVNFSFAIISVAFVWSILMRIHFILTLFELISIECYCIFR